MSHIKKLDIDAFDFPVEMTELYVENPLGDNQGFLTKVPTNIARAVVRRDTNQVLGVHGQKYALVPYRDQFLGINDALEESGLDLSDIDVIDHVYEDGAKIEREIIFNKHRFDVGTPQLGYREGQPSYYNTSARVGDTVALVLRLRNSYDGGWAYETSLGGKRLRCLNGVWILDSISRHRGKHTVNLSNTAAIEKVRLGLTMIESMRDKLIEMQRTPLTEHAVKILFEKTLAYIPRTGNDMPPYSDRTLTQLMNIWDYNATELGANKWAAYNAATEWASHPEDTMRANSQAHQVRVQREAKVQKMLTSREWLASSHELVAA